MRTIRRCPTSRLGALCWAPRTVKMAYLRARAGTSWSSAVRRGGSVRSVARSVARRTATRAFSLATIVSTSASYAALVKAARAAQAQLLVERRLERIVARFDRAVLVRLACVAAARPHAVVLAQRGVAAGELFFFSQVVEG